MSAPAVLLLECTLIARIGNIPAPAGKRPPERKQILRRDDGQKYLSESFWND